MPGRVSVARTAGTRPAGGSELLLKAAHGLEKQLALKAHEFLRKGRTQIRIALDPPRLGKLRVDLELTEGRAAARIIASTPEAAALLARDREELVRAFQNQGIEDVRVEIAYEDAGSAGGRNDEEDRRDRAETVPAAADGKDDTAHRSRRPATSRAIDVVA